MENLKACKFWMLNVIDIISYTILGNNWILGWKKFSPGLKIHIWSDRLNYDCQFNSIFEFQFIWSAFTYFFFFFFTFSSLSSSSSLSSLELSDSWERLKSLKLDFVIWRLFVLFLLRPAEKMSSSLITNGRKLTSRDVWGVT